MASVADAIASISKNAGIAQPIVFQTARRLREDDHLPTSSGCRSAKVTAAEVALLLLGSLTATTARDATRSALTYAALTYDGASGADDNGEWPTTLHRLLTGFIDAAWHKRRSLPFGELILDLSVPAASMKLYATVENEARALNLLFVAAGESADAWSTKKVRQESRLPAEAFYGIIADLQRADECAAPRFQRSARYGR